MANSKGRANRLRVMAIGVSIVGLVGAFVLGFAFPAEPSVTIAGVKITNYVVVAESGEGAFNWLFALLVLGPALVAAAVLYSSSELVAALRRSGRTRLADDDGVSAGPGTV